MWAEQKKLCVLLRRHKVLLFTLRGPSAEGDQCIASQAILRNVWGGKKSVSYFIQFLMQGLAHMRLMIHFMCLITCGLLYSLNNFC
jgi:hypothetical protein